MADRFLSLSSSFTASLRDSFSVNQINLQGLPAAVAFSPPLLCLASRSSTSAQLPL